MSIAGCIARWAVGLRFAPRSSSTLAGSPTGTVEVARLVVGLPVAREAEHVVGIDQRDHQAEGALAGASRAALEELERLLEVGGVVAGAAAAEVLGPRVAAGVGRDPALEPVRRELLRGQLPVAGRPLAEVPLAAPVHVVATVAQHRAEVRQVRGEDPLGRRERPVVGERVDHAVLGRHQPGQEAGPARAAHRRVAGRLVEAHPVPQEPGPRGHVLLGEARRPVHRRALLVGDDEDDVRPVLHSSFAFAPSNSASVRAPFSRSSLSLWSSSAGEDAACVWTYSSKCFFASAWALIVRSRIPFPRATR